MVQFTTALYKGYYTIRGVIMQNTEIEKAIPWNPRHGCKKVSPGYKNRFVYKMDQSTEEIPQ